MKGIFRKDMLQIVLSWKVLLLVAVLVSSALVYFDAAIGLISFFPIFFAMQASSTIIADRHCGWYRFSTTAPITRKRLVLSKYQLGALLAFAGMITGLAAGLGVLYLRGQSPAMEDVLMSLYLGIVFVFTCLAFLIPLEYLMKKTQEFLAIVLAMIPPAAMIFAWSQSITSEVQMVNGDVIGMNINMNMPLLQGLAVVAVLLFVASAFLMPGRIAKTDQE
ncbi:ABC-2 transporter permease [Faecalibaculum rodentium]|uniref:ABC-2 transporter permease n=1 Tax=Faecalibaculum rodentium TaxID=1702221 RepID=UPI002609DA3B|nr:ABC-2 transporter permease [Faecalibaculum rodentium]